VYYHGGKTQVWAMGKSDILDSKEVKYRGEEMKFSRCSLGKSKIIVNFAADLKGLKGKCFIKILHNLNR
jgi:hypothetical protein